MHGREPDPNPNIMHCADPWLSTALHLREMVKYLPILNPHTVIYEKADYKCGVPVVLINWALAAEGRKLDLPVDGIYDSSGSKEEFLGVCELEEKYEIHQNKANIIWSERKELGENSDSETSDDES